MATKLKYPVGELVLIRANRAGVWAGRLVAESTGILRLDGARRLWSWTGALDCSVLARRGPTGGRLGDPTDVILGASAEVVEVHRLSDGAWARIQSVLPWQP